MRLNIHLSHVLIAVEMLLTVQLIRAPHLFAAESFSWAAFAAYVNGNFSDAVANQKNHYTQKQSPLTLLEML